MRGEEEVKMRGEEVVVKESGEGAKEEVSTQVLESLYKKAVKGNASA